MSNMVTFLITVFTSVFGSSGLWLMVQFFLTRRHRELEARRTEVETKRQQEWDDLRRTREEQDRRALLAEAQATAQQTALESADSRYKDLRADYTTNKEELTAIRSATWTLASVLEMILVRMKPNGEENRFSLVLSSEELDRTRNAVDAARHLLR